MQPEKLMLIHSLIMSANGHAGTITHIIALVWTKPGAHSQGSFVQPTGSTMGRGSQTGGCICRHPHKLANTHTHTHTHVHICYKRPIVP